MASTVFLRDLMTRSLAEPNIFLARAPIMGARSSRAGGGNSANLPVSDRQSDPCCQRERPQTAAARAALAGHAASRGPGLHAPSRLGLPLPFLRSGGHARTLLASRSCTTIAFKQTPHTGEAGIDHVVTMRCWCG